MWVAHSNYLILVRELDCVLRDDFALLSLGREYG